MIEILILIYVLENFFMIYRQYKKPMGIFSPVYIVAFMSLGQMLPQLTTIYYLPNVYDRSIMYNLLITMITCNFAFFIGCENKKTYNKGRILDIKNKYILLLILLFTPCSFIFDYIVSGSGIGNGVDGVIAFQFQALGFISLILCLVYLRNHKFTLLLISCLIISTYPILHYAWGIYGSRLSTFVVALLYAYLLAVKYPQKYNVIKKYFTIFFVVGCIGSLSISDVRNNMSNESISSVGSIDFIGNMKKAFAGGSYNYSAGMDLGNAALGINYCFENNEYNLGAFIWNGFVFNYIPKRFVGENVKKSMIIPFEADKYIQVLTRGITCTTGYYDAFSSFSWFGFIVFYILARLFVWLRSRGEYSVFYMVIYFFMLSNIAVAITHGLQLVLAKIEFLIILFCFLGFMLYRKNLNKAIA